MNAGNTPSYQWKVNGVNAGTNSPTFTTNTLVSSDAVTCDATSSGPCFITAPSNTITYSTAIGVVPVATIVPSANPACAGSPVTFNATGNISTGTYQWKVNGVNAGPNSSVFTYVPGSGNVVGLIIALPTGGCYTAPSVSAPNITMSLTPAVATAVSIATSSTSICVGSTVTFTATPTNGGSAPAYQWKRNGVNAGTNSAAYTLAPLSGDVITSYMTSNATCASPANAASNAVTITIAPPIPASVTIAASQNGTCAGTPITFTATPTNGGATPAYQWKRNGVNTGTNSAIYTAANFTNGEAVTCVLTSSAACATPAAALSNSITVSVVPSIATAISITATRSSLCAGDPVTFTATPTNGGATPVYQWVRNGSNVATNSPVFTYNPQQGDVVLCRLASSVVCPSPASASSNALTMSVTATTTPILLVSVVPATALASGQSATFTATAINAGASPGYQWYKNNIAIAGATARVWVGVAGSDFKQNDAIVASVRSFDACPRPDTARSLPVVMKVQGVGIGSVTFPDGFSLYPNPAKEVLIVEGLRKGDAIALFDAVGKLTGRFTATGATKELISISNLAPGIYFVEFARADGAVRWEVKVIKE